MEQCEAVRPGLPVIIVGYSAVLVLLCIYCHEDGLWHKNPKYESIYVSSTLTLIPISHFVAAWRQWSLCFYQANAPWQLAQMLFRQVALLILISEMKWSFWPTLKDRFLERRSRRKPCRRVSEKAAAIAHEIEQTLEEVLEQLPTLVPHRMAAVVVFFLFMLEETLMSSETGQDVAYFFAYALLLLIALNTVWVLWNTNHGDRQIERLCDIIHGIVKSGDKDTLQFVLTNVSVASLFDVGGQRMLDLLTTHALDRKLLNLLCKAIVVNALQVKGLRFHTQGQMAVVRIMTSCRGTDLTALKNIIDGSGDYNNLYKLIHEDMSKASLRKPIEEHIDKEGRALRVDGKAFGIKVLSDVDDTLYSSGGHFPAGCDQRYPKHMVYPGCLSFFRILDSEEEEWSPEFRRSLSSDDIVSCNLVFLSARPHIYKDVAEGHSYRLFKSLVNEARMHSLPTLIPGELWAGLKAMVLYPFRKTLAWREVGINKFRTYRHFERLYPEYDFVFCGDNGQGDLYAGQLMLRYAGRVPSSDAETSSEESSDADLESLVSDFDGRRSGSPRMLAVVIHEVIDESNALALENPTERGPQWREALRQRNLIFHRSYVGAILELHRLMPQLVSPIDVMSVAEEAAKDFEAGRFAFGEGNHKMADKRAHKMADRRDAAQEELNRDIRAANELLRQEDLNTVDLVEDRAESPGRRSGSKAPRQIPTSSSSGDEEDDILSDVGPASPMLLSSEASAATPGEAATPDRRVTFAPMAWEFPVTPYGRLPKRSRGGLRRSSA